jgi:hypothetical protein
MALTLQENLMQDRALKRFGVISGEQELCSQKTETQQQPPQKAPTPHSRASTSQIRLVPDLCSEY